MYELKNDAFYDFISHYQDCVLDYFIIKNDTPYNDEYSHREAMRIAMQSLDGYEYDISRASLKQSDAKTLFFLPDTPFLRSVKYKYGSNITFYNKKTDGGAITYPQAFLLPPYGTHYTTEDFILVNSRLFPNGTDRLLVYEWSCDWSDYFDDGHEWWGVLCVSVYDVYSDRFVIIMASATD